MKIVILKVILNQSEQLCLYDHHLQVYGVSDRDHNLFVSNYCLQQGKA